MESFENKNVVILGFLTLPGITAFTTTNTQSPYATSLYVIDSADIPSILENFPNDPPFDFDIATLQHILESRHLLELPENVNESLDSAKIIQAVQRIFSQDQPPPVATIDNFIREGIITYQTNALTRMLAGEENPYDGPLDSLSTTFNYTIQTLGSNDTEVLRRISMVTSGALLVNTIILLQGDQGAQIAGAGIETLRMLRLNEMEEYDQTLKLDENIYVYTVRTLLQKIGGRIGKSIFTPLTNITKRAIKFLDVNNPNRTLSGADRPSFEDIYGPEISSPFGQISGVINLDEFAISSWPQQNWSKIEDTNFIVAPEASNTSQVVNKLRLATTDLTGAKSILYCTETAPSLLGLDMNGLLDESTSTAFPSEVGIVDGIPIILDGNFNFEDGNFSIAPENFNIDPGPDL